MEALLLLYRHHNCHTIATVCNMQCSDPSLSKKKVDGATRGCSSCRIVIPTLLQYLFFRLLFSGSETKQ